MTEDYGGTAPPNSPDLLPTSGEFARFANRSEGVRAAYPLTPIDSTTAGLLPVPGFKAEPSVAKLRESRFRRSGGSRILFGGTSDRTKERYGEYRGIAEETTWQVELGGETIDITAAYDRRGNVRVEANGRAVGAMLDARFSRVESHGVYRLTEARTPGRTAEPSGRFAVPLSTNLDEFILGSVASLLAVGAHEKTISQSDCERSGGYPHDDVCSVPGIANGSTDLILWTAPPCVMRLTVRLGNCCKQHDRRLWCSKSQAEVEKIDDEFIDCIANKIHGAIEEQLPWFCWLNPLQWVLSGIYAAGIALVHAIVGGKSDNPELRYHYGGGSRKTPPSCMCEPGGVTTYHCDTGKLMCVQGNPPCEKCSWRQAPRGLQCIHEGPQNPKAACCKGTPGEPTCECSNCKWFRDKATGICYIHGNESKHCCLGTPHDLPKDCKCEVCTWGLSFGKCVTGTNCCPGTPGGKPSWCRG